MGRLRVILLCTTAATAASFALAAPASAADGTCDRVAAPGGSDATGDGSAVRPFRTVQRLADALAPGETGCLRAGTYREAPTITRGGRAGAAVTLRSWPGERATVVGRLVVTKSASFVAVEELWLDGRNPANLPSPTVNGDDVTFRRNDVTNGHTAICFVLGASNVDSSVAYGRAARTQILDNRIHDCGKLPVSNHDHGIYVEGTDDARIAGNWIHDNADRGIQLYPDAQGTEITGNVLDGNGTNLLFSGDLGLAASGNTVSGNLITNAATRFNVESWYPDGNPKGVGNRVTGNCIMGAARDDAGPAAVNTDDGGFAADGNLAADPRYLDRAAGDYRIPPSSPCATTFSADRAAIPGPAVAAAAFPPPGSSPSSGDAPGSAQPAPGTPQPPASAPPAPGPSHHPASAGGAAADASPTSRRPLPSALGSGRAAPGTRSAPAPPGGWTVRLSLLATASSSRAVIRDRARIRLGGRVRDAHGAAPVEIQVAVGDRWRTVARASTAAAGTFDARWRVRGPRSARSLRLRATVPGRGTSNVVTLRVRR